MAIFQKIALNICKRDKKNNENDFHSLNYWFALIFHHNTISNSSKCHQGMVFMSVHFFFSLSWWSTVQSKIIEASRLICHTFPVGPLVLVLFVHSCLFHSFRISPLNTLEECRQCVEEWSQNSVVEARQCLAAQVNAKCSVRIKV